MHQSLHRLHQRNSPKESLDLNQYKSPAGTACQPGFLYGKMPIPKPPLRGEQRTAALAACESPSPCEWRWHGAAVTEGLAASVWLRFSAFSWARSISKASSTTRDGGLAANLPQRCNKARTDGRFIRFWLFGSYLTLYINNITEVILIL